jgi:hypothetical protein
MEITIFAKDARGRELDRTVGPNWREEVDDIDADE